MDIRKKLTRAKVEDMTKEELFEEYKEVYKVMKQLALRVEELEEQQQHKHNERGAGRHSKFTEEQKKQIYLRRAEGKSFRAIAEEFNCSVGLVHKLIKERNTDWRTYGIEELKRKIHIREMYIDGFIKTGDTYKEYLEMKARLKELEEAEQNKNNNTIQSQIENKIKELGYKLGCYNNNLDNILTSKALKEVLNKLEEDYTDIFLRINKKLYIVSISTVDEEKDVILYSAKEYFSRFGNLEDCLDNGDITQEEYNKLI